MPYNDTMSIVNYSTISHAPYTQLIISKRSPLHSHTFFEFSICLDGRLNNVINGTPVDVTEGRVILFRPQDEHIFTAIDKHISRDIYCSPELLKQICDTINPNLFQEICDNPLYVSFELSKYDLQLFERRMSIFNNVSQYNSEQLHAAHVSAITEIFNLWYQSTMSEKQNLPAWIIPLTKQINTIEFAAKPIKEIVAQTNYAHGYVCREFKKHYGITLQEYVNSVKFSFACMLLASGSNNVEEIAAKLNYSSSANFIASFRHRFGVTPSQWRKINRTDLK